MNRRKQPGRLPASRSRSTAPAIELIIGVDQAPTDFRLSDPDYIDVTTLSAGSDRAAAWWARTMFEELIDRRSREAVFRVLLGLHEYRGPGAIAGWRVVERTSSVVRLARAGRGLVCELVVVSDSDVVRLGLAVAYRSVLGALVWRWVAPVHRRQSAALLQRAWAAPEGGVAETRTGQSAPGH